MEHPLHILHITLASDAGGLSRYLLDLCAAMHARGHRITIAGDRGAWHDAFQHAPWPWIDVPLKRGLFSVSRSTGILRDYIAANPADVIHTHYRRATLAARRLQSGPRAARTPPILYSLHLSHISLRGYRRWLSDFGDSTHAPSQDARQWLIDAARVNPDRIAMIPHGIDVERFKPPTSSQRLAARAALGLPDAQRLALYVGRFDYPKNVDWLLDLAVASRAALPNFKLLLLGEGPDEPHLRRRIEKEKLANRVQILSRRDPLPIYHAADALLLASEREGFSLVCAEAMACGIPVLRTRTSGSSDLILEGVTGRTTPIDHDAFIAAAIDFVRDPAAQSAMGSAAIEHIRQHFTFERQAEQTIALYRRLAAATSTPTAAISAK